jgi:L-seryl-tRNA(Ser) seleniumtransferase
VTRRKLPRVDAVLAHPSLVAALRSVPRELARAAAREVLGELRAALRDGATANTEADAVAAATVERVRALLDRSLRRCINATGVVLHTGLGRAPLSETTVAALVEVASGYANVQSDPGSGERMPRELHVEGLLHRLTGAEAAAVVNNNAAATVLVLNHLAAGREVIISRGEMVEIGGSFRLPDIVRLSGCKLVEVGCTNRTHLHDYRRAITSETALILAAHQSNYRITGFTAQPTIRQLVALAGEAGVALAHDLGSGALLDLTAYGLPHEPTVQESLAAGAAVVFFSGDKLLGGPQCGVILGKRSVVEPLRANPYYRAFRVDKLILTALESTLRLFLDPARLPEQHRVLSVLTAAAEIIRARAEALAARVQGVAPDAALTVERVESETGGGSLAGHTIPSWGVAVSSPVTEAGALAARLRAGTPPVFARVHAGRVLLDLRTVLPGEDELLAAALETVLGTS